METPGGLIRLIAYLTPEQEEELRNMAHERRRAKSDLIREAVAEYLRRLREGQG